MRAQTHRSQYRRLAAVALAVALVGCGSDEPANDAEPASESAPAFVDDVFAAIDAVEEQLQAPQRYFEVTATDQVTNVFVAVDGETAAVAYAYVDDELQPPAPKQTGAEGLTFARADVAFDPERIASGVGDELPESRIEALSVYGDGAAATYVLAVSSDAGGVLDVVVGPDGQVFSVDAL